MNNFIFKYTTPILNNVDVKKLEKYLSTQYNALKLSSDKFTTLINSNRYFLSSKIFEGNEIFIIQSILISDGIINISLKISNDVNKIDFMVYKCITTEPSQEFWELIRKTDVLLTKKHRNICPTIRIACVYDSRNEQYYYFTQKNIDIMIKFLSSSNNIVSYNGDNFDKKIFQIQGKTSVWDKNSYDLFKKLFVRFNYMFTYDSVLKVNFNTTRLYNVKELSTINDQSTLKTYCHDDVKHIKEMYLLYKRSELKVPKIIYQNN